MKATARLGELTRVLRAAGRSGLPVRQVTIDSNGQIKLTFGPDGVDCAEGTKGEPNEWDDLLQQPK
jgi:hypothetical protein